MAGFHFSRFGASVALAAIALAGCKPVPNANQALLNNQSAAALPALPATLPMTDAPAPPVTPAPRVAALPDAPPIRTVRVRDPGSGAGYAYADAAYQFSDALGEAPPDYGFDYQGVEPWAWQGYDDSVVFAEPVSGGYRTYYYRPGAEQPYFVRDPYYSYGYDDGQLAVVYAADGAIVPWADYGPQVIYASRYLVRGRDLWRASRERRIPISAGSWSDRRGGWLGAQQQWGAVRARQPMWSSYAQADAPAQSHWQAEQVRRAADTSRFARWQAQGFRSAPPPRAIPPQWQQASWARDTSHFAPAAAAIAGGAVMAHEAAVTVQRGQVSAIRQQQEQQARLADSMRVQQEQARMLAQRQQQQAPGGERRAAMQAQIARQQQAQATDMARRERQGAQMQREQAAQAEQRQSRAADLARREQADAAHAQQVRATGMMQQRERQASRMQQQAARAEQQQVRAQQQQARAAAMTQRREQQAGEMQRQQAARMEQQQARAAEMAQQREQAGAARAQEMQARAQQQQARAAEMAQRAQMHAARPPEQHAPGPAPGPREHQERPRDRR